MTMMKRTYAAARPLRLSERSGVRPAASSPYLAILRHPSTGANFAVAIDFVPSPKPCFARQRASELIGDRARPFTARKIDGPHEEWRTARA